MKVFLIPLMLIALLVMAANTTAQQFLSIFTNITFPEFFKVQFSIISSECFDCKQIAPAELIGVTAGTGAENLIGVSHTCDAPFCRYDFRAEDVLWNGNVWRCDSGWHSGDKPDVEKRMGENFGVSTKQYNCFAVYVLRFAPNIPEPPTIPSFDIFKIIAELISDFLKSISFSITAPEKAFINQPISVDISLTSPTLPDPDFSDGSVTKLYYSSFVSREGVSYVVQPSQIELSSNSKSETITFTPTESGRYVVGAIIISTTNKFENGAWKGWSQPQLEAQDKKLIVVESVVPPPPPPIDIFAIFQNFFRKIFCSLLGVC